ncbi:hypothetical protein ACJIZ3_022060 [Penstemon smallii]|uniref:Eukaryotic translation initiation factor 3 subunit G n=1 Tax=Penstemon smallii TaxID=265156 RepID=A0ABD3SNW0_9LAMI
MALMNLPRSSSTLESKSNLRWGEIGEDEHLDLNFFLPPKQVIGPDENGIKIVIEYKLDEEGRKVKVTTTTRVRKTWISKRALMRRSWAKFGDAVHDDVQSRLTMVSRDTADETKNRVDGSVQIAGKGGGVLIVCRACGKKGDHWTSKCPVKDFAPQAAILGDTNPAPISISLINKTGFYVPPSMRNAGVERSSESLSSGRRNDSYPVRVSNLPKDVIEDDLQELFSHFGPLARVYIVRDLKTGLNRGYGFVNYYKREDAQKAIDKLNGYGYDYLILRVDWGISSKQS